MYEPSPPKMPKLLILNLLSFDNKLAVKGLVHESEPKASVLSMIETIIGLARVH